MSANRPSTATPNVVLLAEAFPMPQLGRTRRVWLYLPTDYASGLRHYPVLYLQDGQNCFDAATAFAGEWGVDETLRGLQASGQDGRGCIVVAVANDDAARLDEYSPWGSGPRGGQGDQYLDFVVRTLKPYLDAHYRTEPGREHTGIGGSSMGGLIAVYAGLKYQEVFSKVLVFSPSVWLARSALLRYARIAGRRRPMRFYLLAGAQESPLMVRHLAELHGALLAAGFGPAELSYQTRPEGQHNEAFWGREFAAAYQWLYGPGR